MLYEFLTGLIDGLISGIVPGMHINAIVQSIEEPISIIVAYPAFILSSFIPPIYLYSMNTEIGAAMLPSQRMALQGKGREALLLSMYGALLSFLIVAPLLFFMEPLFSLLSSDYIALPVILLTIGVLFIKQRNRFRGLFIFLLTGFLGIASMNITNGLMPMLSGFFGLPVLLQKGAEIEIPQSSEQKGRRFLPLLLALLLGITAASVKAVTPGIISILLYLWLRSDEERMLSMGALLGANAIATIGNFYTTGALRSGPAVQLATIEESIAMDNAIFLFLLSALLSFILIFMVVNRFAIVYKAINRARFVFIALLALLVILFSGAGGLFLFVVSSTIGVLTVKLKTRRINCMGCIMVPALLNFLY